MATPELRGRKVTVVGLAKSGVAAARLCAREGARVTVTDRRAEADLGGPLAALDGADVRRALGGHDRADFEGADLVVASPGVPLSIPEVAAARARGVPVWGEVELAARFLPGVAVVAITGTNGKSTTTALTGALFARDRRTFTGGNLGTPLCDLVLSGERVDAIVLELSSFQIEGLARLRPRVAAILNVTPDHLDRYRDVEEYAAAKARLFGLQGPGDAAIANARDGRALAMAAASRGTLHTFGFGPPSPGGARDPGGDPGPAAPASRSPSPPAPGSATSFATARCAAAQPRERDGGGPLRAPARRARRRGPGRARRVPGPAAPARARVGARRRRVGERLEGHQRGLDRGRPLRVLRRRGRASSSSWAAAGRGRPTHRSVRCSRGA